ncbi:MAG: TolC family protein [Gracilimonas sp.]|uniref:TolC family protein n=1 Tax=Gracilimonas sp. TaxID=1974203 RepID=UPI001B055564|nr:TolC family protein [Gracilimonas sp.]MBO6586903.1 TolC family protein [Gracilimonas sp.]MBO6614609.1 TolC family protein [Gracilimonas sp.]
MNTFLASLLIFTFVNQSAPSDSVSLNYCYQQAEEYYPAAKKVALQEKITELNINIVNTGYYPQVSVNGRASYQSEVTEFGLPGGGAPPVSKDQYEASIQLSQNIYNGGVTAIRKDLERTQGMQEVLSTKVELQQVRAQIDQVYFGILLSQQQMEATKLMISELDERLEGVRSKVENGVLLKSQQLILEAGLIKAKQDSASIMANITSGYLVLGELIGEKLNPFIKLTLPDPVSEGVVTDVARPEMALFENSVKALEQQKKLVQTGKIPRISAFGSAAYGRPGLNFLNDDFHDYYMVGLRLNWNLMDFLNADEQNEVLNIRQKTIRQNEESFTLQLQTQLSRIEERIKAIKENIIHDKEIIEIRELVVAESSNQLENGVITATEYITELTHANRARLSLLTNEIKLVQARAEYRTALGLDLE